MAAPEGRERPFPAARLACCNNPGGGGVADLVPSVGEPLGEADGECAGELRGALRATTAICLLLVPGEPASRTGRVPGGGDRAGRVRVGDAARPADARTSATCWGCVSRICAGRDGDRPCEGTACTNDSCWGCMSAGTIDSCIFVWESAREGDTDRTCA
jgi:hypothetical protein